MARTKRGLPAIPDASPVVTDGMVAPSPLHQGERLVEAIESTLAAGERCIADFNQLDPIVQQLVTRLRDEIARTNSTLDAVAAARHLTNATTCVDRLAKAAQAFLRTTDALGRLAVLLQGGVAKKPDPKTLTEKQMVGVIIETAKRIKADTGTCPVCDSKVVEAEPA